MCGFAGFWDLSRQTAEDDLRTVVRRMATTIDYRGPDDSGEWVDASAGIALGFRRLSIIDLSAAGHQPMRSATGRFTITFNGEVYNAPDIRKELESIGAAPSFRGHSDTEVMLAAIEAWGLPAAVSRFVGMFAFALWDGREHRLSLVRDRLGVKPLYYGRVRQTILFGSELKPLRAHPDFHPEIDRNALALLMRHNYIPGPHSIYTGVSKLPPGTILTFESGESSTPTPQPYWSPKAVVEAGVAAPFTGTAAEAEERLDALLRDAVRLRMVADVPLGVFLSGGIDSSLVTALMQVQSSARVKTFSIGFREDSYNEAQYAKEVARHLGTDHTELYVSPEDSLAVIPKLPTLYDEPFADSSQIPTYLVSAMARKHVTVSLSGDGGDELFGGYNRYFLGAQLWRKIGWLPRSARKGLARTLRALSPQSWQWLFQQASRVLPRQAQHRHLGDQLHKVAEILSVNSPEAMYHGLVSHWKDPAKLVLGAREPDGVLTDQSQWPVLPTFTERMMYLDLITYLPDDILVKVDRASMGVSLEAREPLLDHRLAEFAWQLPIDMKVKNGQGKWLLRQVLYRYVPRELIERPKTGFGIPIGTWLRGPLRDWAETLLAESRLRQEQFFDPQPIREKWAEHLSGKRNWQYYLWDVLMFQGWLEHYR